MFKWQLADDTGAPQELRLAEQLARGQKQKGGSAEVREWVAQPKVGAWLRLEPALAGVNLAPYFTFSRDRLATLITAPRLSAEQQQLLSGLQNDDVDPQRVKAVQDVLKLDDDARADLLPALLEAAANNLTGAAGKSLQELAKQRPEVATAMFDMLDTLPVSKAKPNFALDLATDFKQHPRTRAVLERWHDKGRSDVKRQAERGLLRL